MCVSLGRDAADGRKGREYKTSSPCPIKYQLEIGDIGIYCILQIFDPSIVICMDICSVIFQVGAVLVCDVV
jgi:hypothetical protein